MHSAGSLEPLCGDSDASNFGIDIPEEKQVFWQGQAAQATPEGIPYRELENLALFNENVRGIPIILFYYFPGEIG